MEPGHGFALRRRQWRKTNRTDSTWPHYDDDDDDDDDDSGNDHNAKESSSKYCDLLTKIAPETTPTSMTSSSVDSVNDEHIDTLIYYVSEADDEVGAYSEYDDCDDDDDGEDGITLSLEMDN